MFWISAFKCTIDWTPVHRYILIRAAMIKRKMMNPASVHPLVRSFGRIHWWDDKCLGGVIIQYGQTCSRLQFENIQLHTCPVKIWKPLDILVYCCDHHHCCLVVIIIIETEGRLSVPPWLMYGACGSGLRCWHYQPPPASQPPHTKLQTDPKKRLKISPGTDGLTKKKPLQKCAGEKTTFLGSKRWWEKRGGGRWCGGGGGMCVGCGMAGLGGKGGDTWEPQTPAYLWYQKRYWLISVGSKEGDFCFPILNSCHGVVLHH